MFSIDVQRDGFCVFNPYLGIRRKNVIPPSMHKFFRYPKFSETLKGCPQKFRHCETKNFRRKNAIPPFSSIKLFENKNFLKNSRIPLRKISALWDMKIVICPLLSINFFDTRKFPENRRVALQNFSFRSFETKTFDRTVMPPLLCMKIFVKRIFLKHQSVVQSNNLVQWDKNSNGKSCDNRPSHTIFFPIRNFLKQNGSLANFFGPVRFKIFSTKPWSFPPPLLEMFR